MKQSNFTTWFKSGTPWVWMNAGAVAIAIIMTLGLLLLIAVRGLSHFWPADIVQAQYSIPGQPAITLIGEVTTREQVTTERLQSAGLPVDPEQTEFMDRELLKVGNRDLYGADFRWIVADWLSDESYPEDILVIERREWGNFYGYLKNVTQDGQVIEGEQTKAALDAAVERAEGIYGEIHSLETGAIGKINSELERLRLRERGYELDNALTADRQAELAAERAVQNALYAELEGRLVELYTAFNRDSLTVSAMDGQEKRINLAMVVRVFHPNAMSVTGKLGHYFAKLWEFLSAEPREANTEGGVFPAIFGTVMMVLLMSIIVTPFGVLAAVYLREYAKQGVVTRTIRIAVNNLAGVPSIVYGVFGLGFFIYFLGGSIDQLFFPEALPSPTLGTGGRSGPR